METELRNENNENEKKVQLKINSINKIILNILCSEAIRKIKFILHILKEMVKKKTNVLNAYLNTKIDNLATDKDQKKTFYALQNKIEKCENAHEYNLLKQEIDKYIDSLKEQNEILCQNSPEDRNLKENRNKIIQDGVVLLNILRNLRKLDFLAVTNELHSFKDEQNLLINLKESVFHKRQIISILKEQIKEQIENTARKKEKIEKNIELIEKEKKIFFVKSMLYYIYKNEYVQANVFNYNINMSFKTNLQKQNQDKLEDTLDTYENINSYIQNHLNKRNDHLQHIHDELVEYYEKEKLEKDKIIQQLEQDIKKSIENIELKKNKIKKYEETIKNLETIEKNKLQKEIEEREFKKKYNESILFLQYIGRKKIIEEKKIKGKKKKDDTTKKKNISK